MKPTGTSAKRKADEVHAPVDAPVQVNRPGEEIWPIERVRAHVRNARKHPKKQIDDLRAPFREYGQVHTLLVREDGTLIAGLGRLEAMKHEGFSHVAVNRGPRLDRGTLPSLRAIGQQDRSQFRVGRRSAGQ
jgi:hypothetical protein